MAKKGEFKIAWNLHILVVTVLTRHLFPKVRAVTQQADMICAVHLSGSIRDG